MHLIPDTQIGLYNAWIFSAVYGALSIGIMISLPNKKRKRIVTLPKFNSKTEKIAVGITSLIFARGLIFYSVFVPLKMYTVSFYIGSAVYLAGMISSVYAMWSFSRVDLSGPVTGGIFRVTRHPMQVMSIVMWIGVGIATMNWIIIACAVLLAILYNPSFRAQERFCGDKYGEDYADYMKRTPRYLFFR